MAYTTIDKPSENFSTILYTGNNTYPRSLTGFGHQPDFVWFKHRTVGYWHQLYDSVRGTGTGGGVLYTNRQDAQDDTYKVNSFDSDGVTIPSALGAINDSGNVVGWSWKANGSSTSSNTDGDITSSVSVNTTAGFSIGTFTGTGSIATVGTGLTGTQMVWLKNRDTASTNWVVYHDLVDGSYDYLYLNDTNDNANSSLSHTLGNTFKVGTNNDTNATGDDYVFYAFKSIKGYSKLSTYTGNGNADGAFIYTGFKPAFILIKGTSTTRNWNLIDHKRLGYNPDNDRQYPNLFIADNTADAINILSNGFKCIGTQTDTNSSGVEYIYYAIAENPFVSSGGVPATAR